MTVTRLVDGSGPDWPKGVVFDCDGLLVDTAACWRRAYDAVLAPIADGDAVSLAELNGASVGIAADRLGAQLGREILPEAIHAALLRATRELPIAPLPGAIELVRKLRGRCPLAIATNAPGDVVRQVVARAGLEGEFDVVVASDEVGEDKPAPHVYEAACDRIAVEPSDAIAFEDSALGAESARRAGLLVIGVSQDGAAMEVDMRLRTLADPRLAQMLQLDQSVSG